MTNDCLGFNFKRAAPTWPFTKDGRDYSLTIRASVEANNGETRVNSRQKGSGLCGWSRDGFGRHLHGRACATSRAVQSG